MITIGAKYCEDCKHFNPVTYDCSAKLTDLLFKNQRALPDLAVMQGAQALRYNSDLCGADGKLWAKKEAKKEGH